MTTAFLTLLALVAFAANSLFARLALADASIDPSSYTTVRLVTGAATLWLIASVRRSAKPALADISWAPAAMLFLYAATFSFAYLSLTAGMGALILFAAVQITMIGVGLHGGERPSTLHWVGLSMAVAGLVYLVSPGIAAPPALGALLMGTAGVAWGIYSILGRAVSDPISATAKNFLRAVPWTVALTVIGFRSLTASAEGLIWAALSGSITSAVGYVIWYAALRGLTATLAATVQLAVPALAALGGVVFLSEPITLRLVLSAALILAGVGLAILSREK
jgi:drug/metabolite transporter (DMT)-like permease